MDSKLESSEQRIQNTLDRLMMAIEALENHWNTKFALLEKDIGWIMLLTGALVLPLLIAILGVVLAK